MKFAHVLVPSLALAFFASAAMGVSLLDPLADIRPTVEQAGAKPTSPAARKYRLISGDGVWVGQVQQAVSPREILLLGNADVSSGKKSDVIYLNRVSNTVGIGWKGSMADIPTLNYSSALMVDVFQPPTSKDAPAVLYTAALPTDGKNPSLTVQGMTYLSTVSFSLQQDAKPSFGLARDVESYRFVVSSNGLSGDSINGAVEYRASRTMAPMIRVDKAAGKDAEYTFALTYIPAP